jgi:hypothetical protein
VSEALARILLVGLTGKWISVIFFSLPAVTEYNIFFFFGFQTGGISNGTSSV